MEYILGPGIVGKIEMHACVAGDVPWQTWEILPNAATRLSVYILHHISHAGLKPQAANKQHAYRFEHLVTQIATSLMLRYGKVADEQDPSSYLKKSVATTRNCGRFALEHWIVSVWKPPTHGKKQNIRPNITEPYRTIRRHDDFFVD